MPEDNSSKNWETILDVIRKTVSGKSSRRYQSRFRTSDVAQESAVQLILELRKDFAGAENGKPVHSSWLRKIGLGTAARMRRSNDARCRSTSMETSLPADSTVSPSSSPDKLAALRELSAKLLLALGYLDATERKIIDRHFRKQESLASIARDLGLSPRMVQRIHVGSLEKLRASMSKADST